MEMSKAQLGPTVKRVAKTVADLVAKKKRIKKAMDDLSESYSIKMNKLNAELEEVVQQQELFESPIRQLTGGYGTEDLVVTELVETGTDKNGRPLRSVKYNLKYPDTVIPPVEEAESTEAIVRDESAVMAEAQDDGVQSPDPYELPFGD